MLDIQQFKNLILVPTLKAVDLYSESAVNLLLGTAIQESRLTYLKQKGGGPALGLFQIEPRTLDDIYFRYLQREDKKGLWERVQQFTTRQDVHVTTRQDVCGQVIGNIPFAVVIARIRYLMVPEALPAYDDLEGLGKYYKKYFNTSSGKGEVHEFVENYKKYVDGIRRDR